jgi:tetratricopeptide (TPR) repeat protein
VDAEAVAHFEAAARLDPDFVDAHAWAGLVHVEARQPSLALPYYQQAVRLEPANAALLSNLASVLIVVNRPAEAEPAARRAVQLAPSSVEAHFMLGLALFARGQATEETVAHLTIAADKYPRAREMLATIQLILASQAASTR